MLCKISQKMLFFRQAGHFRKNAPLLGSFSSAPQGTAGGGYILTQASICSETSGVFKTDGKLFDRQATVALLHLNSSQHLL